MTDQNKRALRRRCINHGRLIVKERNEKLVYLVKFGIAIMGCLSVIEIASMGFLGAWNSEVFSAITGICGIIIGTFIGRKTDF